MNDESNTQRTLAVILLVTGLSAVVVGLILGLLIDPMLFIVSGVGISDLVISRWFLTKGEKALPSDVAELQD